MVDIKEFREKTIEQLKEEVIALRKEEFSLRMQLTSGNTNNTAKMGFIRKDIARIKTILSEKNNQKNVK